MSRDDRGDMESFLRRHDREVEAHVRRWVRTGMPIPSKMLAELWPDPTWRDRLRFMVFATHTGRIGEVEETSGFLLDIRTTGARVVLDLTADAPPFAVAADHVVLPHPAGLGDRRQTLLTYAASAGIEQPMEQLRRPVFLMPDRYSKMRTDHAFNSVFDGIGHVEAVARELGLDFEDKKGPCVSCGLVRNGNRYTAQVYFDDALESRMRQSAFQIDHHGVNQRFGAVPVEVVSDGMLMASRVAERGHLDEPYRQIQRE